jgi:hypothetical protein
MRSSGSANGADLLGMLAAGTQKLEQYAFLVNSMNVFPVPDGDTGTNMLLSMRHALEEARSVAENSASAVAEAFARGALTGARGNSGIILSQFWRGLAQGTRGKKSIRATDLATSMQRASVLSFQALSKPVEGTILTVIQDIAAAAQDERAGKEDLTSFMKRLVQAGRESVANTPLKLPILREAGVVDAGGQGLQIILEGMLEYFAGGSEDGQQEPGARLTGAKPARLPLSPESKRPSYGYCSEFVLRGHDLEPDTIRVLLENRGESLVVAGNENMVRVHLHTPDPDSVVRYAGSLGQVEQVTVRDMDEQHATFLKDHASTPANRAGSVIALIPGAGLVDLFDSLGATAVSVEEQYPEQGAECVQKVIEAVDDREVILLPDSPYLLPVVQNIRESAPKPVRVVPAQTIPQGIAAVLAFNPEESIETNERLMNEALAKVHSIEICSAARYSRLSGSDPHDANVVGLLEGKLEATGENAQQVLEEVMSRLDVDDAELVTVYVGRGYGEQALQAVCSAIRRNYPHLEVETIFAGPFPSDLIISVE